MRLFAEESELNSKEIRKLIRAKVIIVYLFGFSAAGTLICKLNVNLNPSSLYVIIGIYCTHNAKLDVGVFLTNSLKAMPISWLSYSANHTWILAQTWL